MARGGGGGGGLGDGLRFWVYMSYSLNSLKGGIYRGFYRGLL